MNSEGPCGNFEVQIKRSTPAEQHYANSLNRLFSLNRINHFTHESSKKMEENIVLQSITWVL